MNTLRDATYLLKRIVDENPKMPASEVWNLFAGQAREEMVDAITEESITIIVGVMKEVRLRTRNAPREPRRVKPLLLATACVFMATLSWVFYRDHLSGHIATAEASSAAVYGDDRPGITFEQRLEQERTLRRDLEQQLAARLVEQEALQSARRKDVEQQLAARQTDQELLAKERARSNDLLEQRLAARQTSEQALVLALARERAHNQALEQELAKRANATPGGERDANVRLSAPASDNPALPAPIEHTAMPAPIRADTLGP
jgi:hypothetical protein